MTKVTFGDWHPQCLHQESHCWLQTVGSSLNTQLSSWLDKRWVDAPHAPPCRQSNLWAASSEPTAASGCQHRIPKPESSVSWQPQPVLCRALCSSQEQCQSFPNRAQVSSPFTFFFVRITLGSRIFVFFKGSLILSATWYYWLIKTNIRKYCI